MKKLSFFLSALLLGGSACVAQTTAVTATVVDSDSTAWASGPWWLSFQVGPNDSNPTHYTIGGSPLSSSVTSQTGAANGSGIISFTVYQSTAISPIGSSWNLTMCPNASAKCATINFSTSGSTLSLSSQINAVILAPRFAAVSGSYGYNDGEAAVQLAIGATYFNVTSSAQRCYIGSWINCNSGGGAAMALTPNGNQFQHWAQQTTSPEAQGWVNTNCVDAMDPPFNATGNGTTDDTAAINAALATNMCVNLGPPSGGNFTFKITGALIQPYAVALNCNLNLISYAGTGGYYIDNSGGGDGRLQDCFFLSNQSITATQTFLHLGSGYIADNIGAFIGSSTAQDIRTVFVDAGDGAISITNSTLPGYITITNGNPLVLLKNDFINMTASTHTAEPFNITFNSSVGHAVSLDNVIIEPNDNSSSACIFCMSGNANEGQITTNNVTIIDLSYTGHILSMASSPQFIAFNGNMEFNNYTGTFSSGTGSWQGYYQLGVSTSPTAPITQVYQNGHQIFSSDSSQNMVLANGTTATTQSAHDNSTKIATTAYADAVSSGTGLSGMTAGQVPIAATATTVTSSQALAGSGAGIVTGPTSSTINDIVSMNGTNGQVKDSGVLITAIPLANLATQAADSVDMNATGSSAAPTAVAMPTCTSGADLYNTSTHSWSCVSVSSGALTQIAQVVLASPAATISFTSIPGTYSNLKLVFTGQTAGSAADLEVNFNSDSTSGHYDSAYYGVNGTSAFVGGVYSTQTFIHAAGMTPSSVTSYATQVTMEIGSYASTNFFKNLTSTAKSHTAGAPSAAQSSGTFNGTWYSTSAITRIDLAIVGGSNFTTGSTATLYGEQ